MKVILGGGLVGLLARDILGDGWTVIPIGRSRFYSYTPPIMDDFIVRDAVIDEYMEPFIVVPIIYRYGYSYAGQILFNTAVALRPYLNKLYRSNVPPHAEAYWRNRIDVFGYGSCIEIYRRLQARYSGELVNNNKLYGVPSAISDHIIRTETGQHLDYERIVSTVPIQVLLGWLGIDVKLPSRDVFYYHLKTDDFNFEGATRLFVADPEIDFHSVYCVGRNNYIIESCKRIELPGSYFMNIDGLNKFDLIAETHSENVICCGRMPQYTQVGQADITCIGRHAVWDDCLDVGSCIKRIIKLGA